MTSPERTSGAYVAGHVAVLRPIGLVLMLWCAGCGGSSSPTSPTAAGTPVDSSAYMGTWSGYSIREPCVPDRLDACIAPLRSGLTVTLGASTPSGRSLEGELRLWAGFPRLTVSGQSAPDGSLTLSGEGADAFGALVLNQWRSMARDGVMTGTLTYTYTPTARPPVTISATLDGVVRPGVTPPPPSIPSGPRLGLHVDSAQGRAGVAQSAGLVPSSYTVFFLMENRTPLAATIRLELTPIGADGREYAVEQGSGNQFLLSGYGAPSGGRSAADANVARPIAPTLRVRAYYSFEDGVGGFVEQRLSVTVR